MDGNVPIRLWDSKVGLSVPSPLAVLLAFFANKCLDSGFDDSEEELGFVLASLLTNYDVIYGYSFADFVSVLRVCGFQWVSVRTTRSADHLGEAPDHDDLSARLATHRVHTHTRRNNLISSNAHRRTS